MLPVQALVEDQAMVPDLSCNTSMPFESMSKLNGPLQLLNGPALKSCCPLTLFLMSSMPLGCSTSTCCSDGEARAACWPGAVDATKKLVPALQVAAPPAVQAGMQRMKELYVGWDDVARCAPARLEAGSKWVQRMCQACRKTCSPSCAHQLHQMQRDCSHSLGTSWLGVPGPAPA